MVAWDLDKEYLPAGNGSSSVPCWADNPSYIVVGEVDALKERCSRPVQNCLVQVNINWSPVSSLLRTTTTMSRPRFKAAILVVSTTASKDPSTDTSAWILKGVFEKEGAEQWDVIETEIVGDVVLDIQRTIKKWTDQEPPMNLILTTGGQDLQHLIILLRYARSLNVPRYLMSSLTRDYRQYRLCFIDMRLDWFMECLLPLWL